MDAPLALFQLKFLSQLDDVGNYQNKFLFKLLLVESVFLIFTLKLLAFSTTLFWRKIHLQVMKVYTFALTYDPSSRQII